jgi:hypothetical protein
LSTETREETYGFVEATLQSQQYRKLSKGQKGIVRRFLAKVTGLSRAQMTRLLGCWTLTIGNENRFQAHSVLETSFDFRLILRLENAVGSCGAVWQVDNLRADWQSAQTC